MNVADYLTPKRIVMLGGTTKAEALGQLVDRLVETGSVADSEALSQAVWKREQLMSTGVGQGIAVPHVRLEGVLRTSMAVGVSRRGITDYETLDGLPVHVIVLIVAVPGDHESYIRLLAGTTSVLKHHELRDAMLEAEEPEQIFHILTRGQA